MRSQGSFPTIPPGFYRVPFSCADPRAVEADLRAAGWTGITHETVSLRRTVTDLAGFARGIVFGNPVIEEIRQRGGIDPNDVAAQIIDEFNRRMGPEPITMPLQANVFTTRMA